MNFNLLKMMPQIKLILFTLFMMLGLNQAASQGFEGYYQHPEIHQNTIVFVAEDDIWKVSIERGLAQRLTTHAEEEQNLKISPDGKTLVYSASYEGPRDMPPVPTYPDKSFKNNKKQ
jgi:tricorn protease